MRVVRGVSGVVTGGVVALTLVMIVAAVLALIRDFPGPGAAVVGWHLAAAALVVAAQWRVDRRRGPEAVATAALVFVVAAALVWTQWWR